jgi:6-pyruvoyl-tetrahydropterin synthase-like protein
MQPPANKNLSLWALIAILLTAIAILSPAFFFGQFSGQDFAFHIQSWTEVTQQWHQGVVIPSWAAGAWNGFGEPRFIFYPPASWFMGASLGQVLPWNVVPEVFLFLVLSLAGVSMHRLARTWLSDEAALAAALIYMAAPYHLVDVYVRSSFSELLAGAILPLVTLCVFNCARLEQPHSAQTDRVRWRNIALVSIVFAAIWLTNAPAALITSYAMAFLLVILAFRRRSFAPLFQGALGVALGLILASAYIVPAVFEQRWVDIEEAISEPLVYANSLVFRWIADPRHHMFNLMISIVAAFEIVIGFTAAMILRRRNGKIGTAWVALVALAILSIIMMLPLTGSVLQFLPKMRFVQFPWRWLMILGISFSIFLGGAIVVARRRLAVSLFYLIILASTAGILCKYFAAWDPGSDDLRAGIGAIQNRTGYDGTVEYHTRFGREADLPLNAPRVALLPGGTEHIPGALGESPTEPTKGSVSIESWLNQKKVFTVASPLPIVAAVHLLNYPAWQIRVNGQPAESEADPDTGQMFLQLPAGTSHVEIHFGWTPDRTVGCAITGVGILILVSIVTMGWRKSPPPTH